MNEQYYFFWKSKLSNWHMCNFVMNGVTYNCGEQAMMAEKAILFNDKDTLFQIMTTSHPKTIQALGRQIKNFSQEVWDKNKYRIMVDLSYARFSQNQYLKDLLLDTGDKILVEASPIDKIWGIGLDGNEAKITPDTEWKGQNLLGKALTEVRNRLKIEKMEDKL